MLSSYSCIQDDRNWYYPFFSQEKAIWKGKMCNTPLGIMEYSAKVKEREKEVGKIKPKQNETLNLVTMESFGFEIKRKPSEGRMSSCSHEKIKEKGNVNNNCSFRNIYTWYFSIKAVYCSHYEYQIWSQTVSVYLKFLICKTGKVPILQYTICLLFCYGCYC